MILDGKKVSLKILQEIKKNIEAIQGLKPGLAVVLVGDDLASSIYVKMKRKACQDSGINSFFVKPNVDSKFLHKPVVHVITAQWTVYIEHINLRKVLFKDCG